MIISYSKIMIDKIKHLHRYEYIHLKCCYRNLYDVKLRIKFHDYLDLMKKHPMTHELSLFHQISYYLHQFHHFIFEVDIEIIREAYESVYQTYLKMIRLEANEELLNDYIFILKELKESLIERGHLD